MRNAKTIIFSIGKGGSAKTASTQAVGAILNDKFKKKVLMIDLDPSGNLSFACGINPLQTNSIYELLLDKCTVEESIQHLEEYDIIPSHPNMTASEQLFSSTGKEFMLKEKLEPIMSEYDFILIDTQPSTNILQVMGLTCADYCVIPMEASFLAMQGIGQLNSMVQSVKKYTNKNLEIAGILLIKYNNRIRLDRAVKDTLLNITKTLNTKIYETSIRQGVAVKEAQGNRMSLVKFAPTSKPAEDYVNFVDEMLMEMGLYGEEQ